MRKEEGNTREINKYKTPEEMSSMHLLSYPTKKILHGIDADKSTTLFAVVEMAPPPTPLLATIGKATTCHTERRKTERCTPTSPK